MWTQFWDMHSGGGLKEKDFQYIYIEAPEEEAKVIFYNRFGHNPNRISCTCCGEDYSISEDKTLEGVTAYHRACVYVYRNKKGKKVSENTAWKMGKGVLPGYTAGYEEVQDDITNKKYISLRKYVKQKDVLVIYKKAITENERKGDVPQQGYTWID